MSSLSDTDAVIQAARLDGQGPGAELVAHLSVVLAELGRSDRGRLDPGPLDPGSGDPSPSGTVEALQELLEAQLTSRWLDVAARRMRAAGIGHYTIGSAGHEGNAAVAMALRATDPALLHYRSGAFYLARASQAGHPDGALDIALGLVAAADEPISGGRHKVFGHPKLAVIPQTSTIASQLPRALGIAWALGRQRRMNARVRVPLAWPDDAVVVTSFGDASANHSTATGAFNAAGWAVRQGAALPLLMVCEDNGLGISVPTPTGWIEAALASRPGIDYLPVDSADPARLLEVAREAADVVRRDQRPVLLHLRCVRIGGHAGSDVESGYRSTVDLTRDQAGDPIAATMRALVAAGVGADELARRMDQVVEQVSAVVQDAVGRPRLTRARQVVAPLAPRRPSAVGGRAAACAAPSERARVFGGTLPEDEGPLTLAQAINRTLLDAGALDPSLLLLGEDVGRKGGVYGVTRGLQRRLGATRVVDTLLDEQTVLGLGLGAAVSGLLPVPEIQYLAYLHNAEDQLRGEAASLQFFSSGAYRNPMVVRIAGLAYQKGFGGHFHNDNSISVLRDIPGLVVACPAHPSDAPALLRTCLAAAAIDGTVSVFLEPIALYHERDMLVEGDGAWTAGYLPPAMWHMNHAPIGRATTWGSGEALTIATFGNGLRMSLRAAARLAAEGIDVRVVDLRWLAPLPVEDVLREAQVTGRLLIVDETRRTGGVSEGLITSLLEAGYAGRLARVASLDSFVPLGAAAELVLVGDDDIMRAARHLVR